MGRTARVRSIDAVEALATDFRVFGEEASVALTELELAVSRALRWVSHDQKEHCTQQIRRSQEQVAEARLNLERKEIFAIGDERPSCQEEKKILEAAKRRLRISQEKLETVHRWSRILEQEVMEFKGGIAPLAGWLQADLPRGLALLHRVSGALEAYVQIPSSPETTSATDEDQEAANERAEDSEDPDGQEPAS
jgi:hypothetical protein